MGEAMIRQLTLLSLLAMLAACGAAEQPQPKPHPPRPSGPPRVEWLSADPDCRGSMRRGEWMVCDNKHLNYLHRTLAAQWEAARRNASRHQLRIQRAQMEALLTERAGCEDTACVATAYRRYLAPEAAPAPAPKPNWTPRPRKPAVRHRREDGGSRYWYRGDGEKSCAQTAGWSKAQYLSRQCDMVTRGQDGLCSTRRTCGDLRDQIRQGCWSTPGKPGFCGRR
jgi:hypothetical protein